MSKISLEARNARHILTTSVNFSNIIRRLSGSHGNAMFARNFVLSHHKLKALHTCISTWFLQATCVHRGKLMCKCSNIRGGTQLQAILELVWEEVASPMQEFGVSGSLEYHSKKSFENKTS